MFFEIIGWLFALTAMVLFVVVFRDRRRPMRTRISPAFAHALTRAGASLSLLAAVLAVWVTLKAGAGGSVDMGVAGTFVGALFYGAVFLLWDRRISMAAGERNEP